MKLIVLTVFLLAAAAQAAQQGIASKYPGDRGIERDPDVILSDNFEGWPGDGTRLPSGKWDGIQNKNSRSKVVDGKLTVSGKEAPGGKILELACWHAGGKPSKAGVYHWLGNYERRNDGRGDGHEEVYIRYYMKLGENYKPVRTHGANLGGRDVTMKGARWVGMAYTRDVSAQGYFYSGVQPWGKDLHLAYYSYHMDKPGQYGDNYKIQNKIRLQPNRWYCLERHMKLNSVNPIQADGLEELWVDGELSIRREGLRFRKVPQLKINVFLLQTYYHALPAEFPKDNPIKIFFENVVIAKKYIGPTVLQPPKPRKSASSKSPVFKPKVAGPLAAHADAIASAEKAAGAGKFDEAAAAYEKIAAAVTGEKALLKLKLRSDGARLQPTLVKMIRAGFKRAGPKRVYVDLVGRTRRAKLTGAGETTVTFVLSGGEFPVQWSSIAPHRLAGVAGKYVQSAAEHLTIAKFLLACGVREAATKAAERVLASGASKSDAHSARLILSTGLVVATEHIGPLAAGKTVGGRGAAADHALRNSVYRPNTLFTTEDLSSPRFKGLRERYRLDDLVRGEKDEFQRILIVRNWLYRRVKKDRSQPLLSTKTDALVMLEKSPEGDNYKCGHFVLMQSALLNSMGYVTRNIFVAAGEKEMRLSGAHVVNEVWLNSRRKWVAIDAEWDSHFEKDGTPLSALEIRDEVLRDGAKSVSRIEGLDRKRIPRGRDDTWGGTPRTYAWISWYPEGNLLSMWPKGRSSYIYVYQDEYWRTHVWYKSGKKHWAYDSGYFKPVKQREAIYWTPNVLKVDVKAEGAKVEVQITSDTPNLKEYQMKQPDGTWEPVQPRFTLPGGGGKVRLLRAMNLAGIAGPVYRLVIE